MYNLQERVNTLIDRETELFFNSMLDQDYTDQIAYYETDIVMSFKNYLETAGIYITDLDSEGFINYLAYNQDQLLDYKVVGFPHLPDRYYAIMAVSEIEITTPDQLVRHKEAVNRFTDLYISDNDLGYIYAEYSYIVIDFSKIPMTDLSEFLTQEKKAH